MQLAIKNLTPHAISVKDINGIIHTIPPENKDNPARVDTVQNPAFSFGTINVYKKALRTVNNLPEPEAGVMLIVSNAVAEVCRNRRDLLVPGVPERDFVTGEIICCNGLQVL